MARIWKETHKITTVRDGVVSTYHVMLVGELAYSKDWSCFWTYSETEWRHLIYGDDFRSVTIEPVS